MFGALMIVDMMIFGFMAYNYTYVNADRNGCNDDLNKYKEQNDNNIEMIEHSCDEIQKQK